MTNEEMERAIQFLIEHHAKVSAKIDQHSEQIAQLNQTVSIMASQAEADRAETREAINSLIVANEVTRGLAESVAKLTIEISQRVTKLESQS